MQGRTLHGNFMYTFDAFKRIIALIFVLVGVVNADAKKIEFSVSTPEEYYDVFSIIGETAVGSGDEVIEYIINVTDDLVLKNGLDTIYKRGECEKIGKVKVKIVGSKVDNGKVKISDCYQEFYGDYSFVNLSFEGARMRFDRKFYNLSFEHCDL